MLSKAELHKRIDAKYSPMVDALKGNQANFWAVCEIFRMWRIEKEYADKFWRPYPKVTNISWKPSV